MTPKQLKTNINLTKVMKICRINGGNSMEMVTDHNPKLVSLLVLKWCIESKQRSPMKSFSIMQPSLSQFVLFLSNQVFGISDSDRLPHFHIRSLITCKLFHTLTTSLMVRGVHSQHSMQYQTLKFEYILMSRQQQIPHTLRGLFGL